MRSAWDSSSLGSREVKRVRLQWFFTDKAVIVEDKGSFHFCFQACEMRKHQLIEAHVRCYAVSRTRAPSGETEFQTQVLRLGNPDDELGGMLLLSLPTTVLHHIDAWSPLLPQENEHNVISGLEGQDSPLHRFDILQREKDRGNDESRITTTSRSKLKSWLEEKSMEILVILEGIDPLTSATLQARHSYTANDIVFDAWFAPCVHSDESGECVIDFAKFHDLRPKLRKH